MLVFRRACVIERCNIPLRFEERAGWVSRSGKVTIIASPWMTVPGAIVKNNLKKPMGIDPLIPFRNIREDITMGYTQILGNIFAGFQMPPKIKINNIKNR